MYISFDYLLSEYRADVVLIAWEFGNEAASITIKIHPVLLECYYSIYFTVYQQSAFSVL